MVVVGGVYIYCHAEGKESRRSSMYFLLAWAGQVRVMPPPSLLPTCMFMCVCVYVFNSLPSLLCLFFIVHHTHTHTHTHVDVYECVFLTPPPSPTPPLPMHTHLLSFSLSLHPITFQIHRSLRRWGTRVVGPYAVFWIHKRRWKCWGANWYPCRSQGMVWFGLHPWRLKGEGLKPFCVGLSWVLLHALSCRRLQGFCHCFPNFSRPNRPKTLFFTPPGRKMSVRTGDVMKQVKNSSTYFGKSKP